MRYMFSFLLAAICLWGQSESLQQATVAAYAVNMKTGEVVANENSGKSMIPGSCIKIVTTAAALHLLGPDYSFETHLEYDGAIASDKTLHGNLYIHGGGDPCLGSDRTSSWKQQIKIWADAVEHLGVRTIVGDVIGDATRWEKGAAAPSWAWEDVGNYYGAGASALSFHENFYTLFFKPGLEGSAATILRTEPHIPTLTLHNEVTTGAIGSGDRACIYGAEFSHSQVVRGTIPAGVLEFSIKGAIPDPAAFATAVLTQELAARGIAIRHQPCPSQHRASFHTTHSPQLCHIVALTNQKSINLYAEHLLKKMGEKVYREGSTTAGIRAIRDFLTAQSIDLKGFNMADGSGLSRKNLVTTKQFVSLLIKMRKSDDFFQSLNENKEGVRSKTGSMSFIRCCAGYTGDIAFAISINHCPDSRAMQEAVDQFVRGLPK
jgi:serine-type D-Ala-D-Ala carboxypeptidase/endopeptidase (penicillin-binding protein 4)